MTRKDYEKELDKAITAFEFEGILEIGERVERLENFIKLGREFNQRYKNPFKRNFMGKPIKYTDNLLDAMEKYVIEEYNAIFS